MHYIFLIIRNCIWQLKNAVYDSMFFLYKKAKNMHKMNENLHIFGLFIICDVEEKRPIVEDRKYKRQAKVVPVLSKNKPLLVEIQFNYKYLIKLLVL
ncbi:hypothetical protein [Heyndrickxia ginsengihumi]|uniref:hypothetical protein n=1 Tax=Heyndrickxia ginsengihumi TaxID=363870 RepID=UPI003D21BCC8